MEEESYIISYITDSGRIYSGYKDLASRIGYPQASCLDREWYDAKKGHSQEIQDNKIPVRVILKTYHLSTKLFDHVMYLIQDTKYNEYYIIGEQGIKLYSNQIDVIPVKDVR